MGYCHQCHSNPCTKKEINRNQDAWRLYCWTNNRLQRQKQNRAEESILQCDRMCYRRWICVSVSITVFTKVLAALDPEHGTFLDTKVMKPFLDLINMTVVEFEFVVEKQFIQTEMDQATEEKWTLLKLLLRHHNILEAMPSVIMALKLKLCRKCRNEWKVIVMRRFTSKMHSALLKVSSVL